MDVGLIIEWIVKSAVLILILLTGFAYTTLYERKALARIQVRIGPNRAGPAGFFQPVADGLKLIFKEELIPEKADKITFLLAPILTSLTQALWLVPSAAFSVAEASDAGI